MLMQGTNNNMQVTAADSAASAHQCGARLIGRDHAIALLYF